MTIPMSRLGLTIIPAVAAIALTAITTVASAQVTSAQQSAIRSSCRADFTSKCSGVSPGGKDALACLQKNVAKLSPACQTAVRATIPAPAVAAPAPAAKPRAPARIVTAPPPPAAKANARRATKPAAPAAAVAPAPPPKQPGLVASAALLKACGRSLILHCRGIEPGGGREVACLNSRMAAGKFIGPRCRAALKIESKIP